MLFRSPGCANCYAEAQNNLRKWNRAGWGNGMPRRRTSEANWREPLRWNAAAGKQIGFVATDPKPRRPRVFCASLADWLDDEVPIEWLADLLSLIHATPNLDWLLLTKRPGNWRSRLEQALPELRVTGGDEHAMVCAWLSGSAPSNIWIGCPVEDQQRAEERIPALLKIPARVQWVQWCSGYSSGGYPIRLQNGERFDVPDDDNDPRVHCFHATDDEGSFLGAAKVGKKAAGRTLDGREWNEFPQEVL